jgi:hypothetical protein
VTKAKAKAKEVELDALDQALYHWTPQEWTKMLLWKNRMANPDLTVQVTEQDIQGFEACVSYLGITTQLKVHRPQGRPAQEAVPGTPGTATRPGRAPVPARPADPPRPFVLVQLLDQDGNAFRPIENTEESRRAQEEAERLHRARDQARQIAAQLQHDIGAGVYSNSTISDAAAALVALAGA